MTSQVYQVLFTVASCLGAGLFLMQALLSCRGCVGRLHGASAVTAGALVLAGIGFLTLRLGRPERLVGGFSNPTSGVTILLYTSFVFVVIAALYAIIYVRSRDARVPRMLGVLGVLVSVGLIYAVTTGYLLSARINSRFLVTCALFLGGALIAGCALHLLMAAAVGDRSAARQSGTLLLPCALLGVAGCAIYLGWFSLDMAAEAAARRSSFSMTTYTAGGAVSTATSQDRLQTILQGDGAMLFWGGAIAVGFAVPLVCSLISMMEVLTTRLRPVAAPAASGAEAASGGKPAASAAMIARKPLSRLKLLIVGILAAPCAILGVYALRTCIQML